MSTFPSSLFVELNQIIMLWHYLVSRVTWPQFSGISLPPPEPWASRPYPISSLMDLLFHNIGENSWIVVVGYNGLIKFCALDTQRPKLHWLTFCWVHTAPIDSLPWLEVWHASIDSQSINYLERQLWFWKTLQTDWTRLNQQKSTK